MKKNLWKSFLTSGRRLVFRGEDDESEALVVLALKSDVIGLRVAVSGHLDVRWFGWAVDQHWSMWGLRLTPIIFLSFSLSIGNIQCLNEQSLHKDTVQFLYYLYTWQKHKMITRLKTKPENLKLRLVEVLKYIGLFCIYYINV